MSLKRLIVSQFRCLETVDLALHPQTNLIVGPNASGKTSLLEAVYFLGRGRSFRSVRTRGLIRDEASRFIVSAELTGLPKKLGVQGDRDGITIHVDGHPAKGLATLAQSLPVQVIEPGIHRLVEAGPAQRRAFLDWGVFHVKHSFLEEWRRYQRALKQRNAALRARADRAAARAWEDALVAAGEAVHQLRENYLEALRDHLAAVASQLLAHEVQASYSRGWPDEMGLADAIEQSWDRDRRVGITHPGPHRADLQLRFADRAARSRVSRGQQKLLAAALVLAQMHQYRAHADTDALLLLDDPAAELDQHSLGALFEAIQEVPAQRFVTGLTADQLPTHLDHGMFHVEQGKFEKMVY